MGKVCFFVDIPCTQDWLIDWLDSVYAVSAIFQTYNGSVHKMSISTENGECMVVYIGYQCTNINE